MTQEYKELLLRDLCARLPYGVKVNNEIQGDFVIYGVCGNYIFARTTTGHVDFQIEKIKPYLFPISSMTEEQEKESFFEPSLLNAFINGYISLFEDEELNIDDLNRLYDWLNKNHFDYRGLIEKGLAIDATNLNIY